MHFGRLDNLFRTLRFRLTFYNTGAILLLVLATLIGLRAALRWTLQHELDTALRDDVDEVRLIVQKFYPDWSQIKDELDRKAVSHKARAWFARVLSEDGSPFIASMGAPRLGTPTVEALPPGPSNVESYRLVQRTFHLTGVPVVVVRVGCSQDFVDEDVLHLSEMMVVAAAVLLVLAPLSGYWLAGRATRPLAGILRTTARLRPDRLVERLPVHGTGDELDRLSLTINGFLDRLATHLARQREFVANAAHELRSPLAAVRTSLEVALDHDRSPEEYRELLADMAEECAALGRLVNQLLLLAEGDAGLVPADAVVRLDRLVGRSVDMFQGIAEQRSVKLEATTLTAVTVRGSDMHLRQVVHNLIDNAVKFTPEGGRVTVEVMHPWGASSPGQALLRVSDTGIGIPTDELPHIFDRFFRADKSRQRENLSEGSGLGLSICQAIVKAYGGRIEVDSALGQGTRVTVLLPLATTSAEALSARTP